MAELCQDWKENGKIYVRCSSLSSMHEHLHSFSIMADDYKSRIFRALWQCTTDRYKNLKEVWETVFEKCDNVVSMFLDCSIEVNDLQDWIGSLDFEAVFQDMSQLINGLIACGRLAPTTADQKLQLQDLCKKVSYYQRARQSCVIANHLLKLSEQLGYRASCELLSKIVKVCSHHFYYYWIIIIF